MPGKGKPIKKGQVLNPQGRPAGSKNKTTLAWEQLGEELTGPWSENLKAYLEELWQENPKEASDLFLKLLEYFRPKKLRQEITGEDGQPLFISGSWVPPKDDTGAEQ